MIEAHDTVEAGGIGEAEFHVRAFPQHGGEIGLHMLVPIDLAGQQRGGGGGGIGDDFPLDPVEMRHLAARRPIRRFLSGRIPLEPRVAGGGTGHELIFEETIGAGADGVGNLFERIGLREMLRHHERDRGAAAGDGVDESGNGCLQGDLYRAIVFGDTGIDVIPHGLTYGFPPRPADQTGDAVLGAHGLAVMELKTIP